MRTIITTTIAIALSAGVLCASEVAPGDVIFDEGAVAQSLSGQPGDAAAGRKVVSSKKLGNCVACHQIAEMADVPFQGEIGPPLDGVGGVYSESELRGIVANAKLTFEASMMPSFYKVEGFIRPGKAYTGKAADDTFAPLLSAQQIEDVVAYLSTLTE